MIHVLRKLVLILSINFVTIQGVLCQTSFKGRIVDSKAEGIPYAHIIVEGTQLGTYSNNEGFFILNIPSPYSSKVNEINITCVGYVPLQLNVHRDDLSHIQLDEDILELSTVEITPRDHAKDLVLNSIRNIPNNYPGHKENYVGFVRETLSWEKSGSKNPLYVAEAVIESSKDPYSMTSRKGHVKLIEGRRYVSRGLDTLRERIISGAHHVHRFDVVARKDEFISNPGRFYYELIDTTRFNNSNIYEVAFSHKNQLKSGSIFIEDSTFVITRVIIHYKPGFDFSLLIFPPGRGRTYLKYEANYYRGYDDKWRLERTSYATAFKRKRGTLNLRSNYATTEIRQSSDISYIDRIQIRDIYLDKTGTYNPDFWANYNIILPSRNTEDLFQEKGRSNTPPGKEPVTMTKKVLPKILTKLKLGHAVNWSGMEIGSYNLTYNNPALGIQHAEGSSAQSTWTLSSFILYEFRPNTFVGLLTESPISKTGITSYDLAVSKDLNLNQNGRPIIVSLGLRVGYQHLNRFINNYTTETRYEIKGKTFDSGKTGIFLTKKQFHLQPNLGLSIEKSNRLCFFTAINYNVPIDRKIGLTFVERNEFLFRKRQFLRNGDESLFIGGNNNNILTVNVSIDAGIFLRF